jgi:holin-like protein
MPEPSQTAALPPAVRVVLGLGVLVGFAALGEGLVKLLHWSLPGSVMGMVLLWAALSLRLVRLHWVEPAADGLLGILGLLFVPATVGAIQFLGAGAQWGLWLLVMAAGRLLGAGVAGLLAARLVHGDGEQG